MLTLLGAFQWFIPTVIAQSKHLPPLSKELAVYPIYPEYGQIRTLGTLFPIPDCTKYLEREDLPLPSIPSKAIIFLSPIGLINPKSCNIGITSGLLVARIAPNLIKVLYSIKPFALAVSPLSTISKILSAHPILIEASTLPDNNNILSSLIPM